MTEMGKPAKSPTDEGNGEEALKNEQISPEPAEPPVPPPQDKGESKQPEDWEQKYKTLVGQHQKLQKDYTTLNQERSSVVGVSRKIDELGEVVQSQGLTLNLLTDMVSTSAEYSEELQGRIKQTKEQQEQATKKVTEAKEAWTKMAEIAQIADLNPPSKEMEPAMQAFQKGSYAEALRLTTIAVKTAVAGKAKPAELAEDKARSVDKAKLKQPNLTPAASENWRDLPPRQKIIAGLKAARE